MTGRSPRYSRYRGLLPVLVLGSDHACMRLLGLVLCCLMSSVSSILLDLSQIYNQNLSRKNVRVRHTVARNVLFVRVCALSFFLFFAKIFIFFFFRHIQITGQRERFFLAGRIFFHPGNPVKVKWNVPCTTLTGFPVQKRYQPSHKKGAGKASRSHPFLLSKIYITEDE